MIEGGPTALGGMGGNDFLERVVTVLLQAHADDIDNQDRVARLLVHGHIGIAKASSVGFYVGMD